VNTLTILSLLCFSLPSLGGELNLKSLRYPQSVKLPKNCIKVQIGRLFFIQCKTKNKVCIGNGPFRCHNKRSK
jgi:hypothetical protein